MLRWKREGLRFVAVGDRDLSLCDRLTLPGKNPPLIQRNPFRFALYISLFPQLIAGPIVRYKDIAAQLVGRTLSREGFAIGARRFVIGLGKKMLIANTVAIPADAAVTTPDEETVTMEGSLENHPTRSDVSGVPDWSNTVALS